MSALKQFTALCVIASALAGCISSGTSVMPTTPDAPAMITIEGHSQVITPTAALSTPTSSITYQVAATAEPTATKRPEATPTSTVLATATISSVVAATPEYATVLTRTLKVAYPTFDYLENGYRSQLWMMDSVEAESQLLLDLNRENTLLDPRVSWSHDGTRIAYAHAVDLESVTVSIINVHSHEVSMLGFSFPLFVFEGSSTGIELRHSSWSLDDNWIQATISVIHPETKVETVRDFLIRTNGGDVVELPDTAEFVEWSTVEANQYLYIEHPNAPHLGDEKLCIGRAETMEPLSCVDVGDHIISADHFVAWSSERSVAVFADRRQATGLSLVVAVNFGTEEVEQIFAIQGFGTPFLFSPDGTWLLISLREGLYFWNWEQTGRPEIPVPSFLTTVFYPLSWLHKGNWLVYQQGDFLAAASPDNPDERVVLVDLSEVAAQNVGWLEISVWPPSR